MMVPGRNDEVILKSGAAGVRRLLHCMSPLWHEAAFRCGANVWPLLEVERTLGARRGHVDR